jgi:hypothetical protein
MTIGSGCDGPGLRAARAGVAADVLLMRKPNEPEESAEINELAIRRPDSAGGFACPVRGGWPPASRSSTGRRGRAVPLPITIEHSRGA